MEPINVVVEAIHPPLTLSQEQQHLIHQQLQAAVHQQQQTLEAVQHHALQQQVMAVAQQHQLLQQQLMQQQIPLQALQPQQQQVDMSMLMKKKRPGYVPLKPKTTDQMQAWETFKYEVANATSGNDILEATLKFEAVDKAQAAFAFNRGKKLLEGLGKLVDEKWERGYGCMGKLKQEFYIEFSKVEPEHLPMLKDVMMCPTSSGDKKKKPSQIAAKIAKANGGVGIVLPSEDVMADKAYKKRKQNAAVAQATNEFAELLSMDMSLPLPHETEAADISDSERIRSIKAARLADAMQHASYNLLSKAQQQAIRQEWMSVLVSKSV